MTSSKLKLRSPRKARLRIEKWRAAIWDTIGFSPHPGQIRSFNNYLLHRFSWNIAGRRGGKSELGGKGIAYPEFVRDKGTVGEITALDREGNTITMEERWPKKILVIAPFYKQARIIFGRIHRLAIKNGIPLVTDRFSENSMEIESAWGSLVMGATAKNIRSLPGYDWDLILGDEVPLFMGDPEEVFEEALFPTLIDSLGSFYGIGTPDFPGSYTFDWKLQGRDPDIKRWGFTHWTTYDNWHMPHFHAELEEIKKDIPKDIFRRQYLAQYVPREGLVTPEAVSTIMSEQETLAVTPYVMDNAEFYRAIDFGFSNPFACITVAIIGDYVWIWDEYYRVQRHLNQHAVVLANFDSRYRYKLNICDPAEPQSIRLLAAHKYKGSKGSRKLGGGWVFKYEKPRVIDRIDLVRRIMSSGHFKIHPRCKELIKEYSLEKYPDRRALRNFDENPVDANNHGTSAVGYLIDFLFGKITGSKGILGDGEASESQVALRGY